MEPDRAAFAFVGAFVDEMARAGIRHVCIAPGSRSAPLSMTIAKHPALKVWMHIDERSGAFFALGLARALDEPVALVCTSGTAAANFLPAVVEARSAGVPLLVLTADRPPELRDVGAAQTIDQNRLFGAHAKWFVEVALPEATPDLLRYSRTLAARATAMTKAIPAGPVHLNFPFREPLVPVPVDAPANLSSDDALAWNGRDNNAPWVTVSDGSPALDDETVKRIATRLHAAKRPLIVCGPQHETALAGSLSSLARALGAPLLADPLSQLRWGEHDRTTVIDRYDAFLRNGPTADSLSPDLILRIGGVPTSKTLLQYLQHNSSAPLIVVDSSRWLDPTLLAEEMVHADPKQLCAQILDHVESNSPASAGSDWLDRWQKVNGAATRALDCFTQGLDEPFEGRALADVVASLPSSATIFVSSSMPVRDLDAFGAGDDRALRVLANRGANGIDGVVSTALGAAAGFKAIGAGPLVLVIGDLALYHDMNGLLSAKLYSLDATVVLLNNDGGGIFSFLPQAAHPEVFEQLFGTPHGLDFSAAAELYAADYQRVTDSKSLRSAVETGIGQPGLHLIELRTDRARNVTLHREAWAAVASAVDAP
ncbi:MAG: 2-succinyl-5-enolpyruvyl-6-hydroxy-3-cyclohexene-1-carboxylic-acid synthase [Gemmatimonadales bacterium]